MFKTRVTEMLGIQYPIIKGGMLWLSTAELVAAVSNAGGLGILSSIMFPSAEELRHEIQRTKTLTDKPFGVNFPLLPTLKPVDYEDYIDVVVEEGVRIVETAGRNPEPYMKRFKEAGVKVIHKTPAVRFAITAERVGVDAVAILGLEGAGHVGEDDITGMILIPLAVNALKIPVIAAGGIGDARGFVAALALGAEGVLMGTRFLATKECIAHPRAKEFVLRANQTDTVLLERSLRNTVRALKNEVADKVLEMERAGAALEDLVPLIKGEQGRKAWIDGDINGGIMSCGEVVGMIREIPSVKEVIDGIINGAKVIVERLRLYGRG